MYNASTLGEIIGKHSIKTVIALRASAPEGTFAKEVCERFIEPRIEIINKLTGQTNSPMFLAYMVEALLDEIKP